MATQQEIRDRIAQIDEDLANGITQTSTDGTTTTVSLEALRRERRNLTRQLRTSPKPISASWSLGGSR